MTDLTALKLGSSEFSPGEKALRARMCKAKIKLSVQCLHKELITQTIFSVGFFTFGSIFRLSVNLLMF